MRNQIELPVFGVVKLSPPRSFVAINDLVSEYAGSQNSRAKLARLSAAVLGLCWSRDNDKAAPVYDAGSGEIVRYGGEVIEWLVAYKVPLANVYNEVRPLFMELWHLMPKEEEVAQAADYFPAKGDSGSDSVENSAAVEQNP